MDSREEKISRALSYAKTFIGVPYRWFHPGDNIESDDKFWIGGHGYSLPTREEIDRDDKSIVCTGLANLMRRYVGLSIPTTEATLPGTTDTWFLYLSKRDRLDKISLEKPYPIGTLVLRNCGHTATDQGHVAVILDDNISVLYQTIIHSCALSGFSESKNDKDAGKTCTVQFRFSHYCVPEGYYSHVCLPENWLLKD